MNLKSIITTAGVALLFSMSTAFGQNKAPTTTTLPNGTVRTYQYCIASEAESCWSFDFGGTSFKSRNWCITYENDDTGFYTETDACNYEPTYWPEDSPQAPEPLEETIARRQPFYKLASLRQDEPEDCGFAYAIFYGDGCWVRVDQCGNETWHGQCYTEEAAFTTNQSSVALVGANRNRSIRKEEA